MDKLEKYRNAYGKETLVEWNIEVIAKKVNELVEFADGLQKVAEKQEIVK